MVRLLGINIRCCSGLAPNKKIAQDITCSKTVAHKIIMLIDDKVTDLRWAITLRSFMNTQWEQHKGFSAISIGLSVSLFCLWLPYPVTWTCPLMWRQSHPHRCLSTTTRRHVVLWMSVSVMFCLLELSLMDLHLQTTGKNILTSKKELKHLLHLGHLSSCNWARMKEFLFLCHVPV